MVAPAGLKGLPPLHERVPYRGFLAMLFFGLWTHITIKNLPYRYEWINQMFPPEKQVKNAWNTK